MQILLVKAEVDRRSAITFILENDVGGKVKEAATLQEGLAALLDDTMKFDVLICDDNADNQKLFKYILASDLKIRCLVLKDPKVAAVLAYPDMIAGYVNPANVGEELKTLFAEEIKKARPEAKAGDDDLYCRIKALTALKRTPLIADVYIRLSSSKYVRLFAKGDKLEGTDVPGFLQKKSIDYLYFLKEEAPLFSKMVREEMEKDFKASAGAPPEAAVRSAASAQEAALELGNRIGFTPEVQAIAKQGMMTTLKVIGSGKPQLAKILKSIVANKDKYVGSHAILTSQIACSLATKVQWSSETTFQKLTFAAFFHDMTITNNTLAQVKDLKELEARKSEFTEDEAKRYQAHPTIIPQLLVNFSEVPKDVDMIIAQHHEKPDGSGFPRGLSGNNISPLSTLFIIAHDLVDHIFANGMDKIEPFLADYKAQHSEGHFKKILAQIDLASLGLGPDSPAAPTPNVSSKPA